MTEEWKWIAGYEGRYEVSNFGRIRSYANGRWGNQSNPFVKKPPMYVPHKCKDGSAGIAMFSGFAKVKE